MSSDLLLLWESAGGKTPSHWEFKTIADLLENSKSISVGVMYPGSNSEGGIPLIRVSDVKNGAVASIPDFCVSEEVDEEYKRTRLNGTEFLITLVGNPGDCVVVTDQMSGWNVARALAVLRLQDIELRSWCRYALLSKPAKHLIEARLNTTVQKTLNLKDIKELGLPIPPVEEREKITTIINAVEYKILLNRQTNQTLEQIAQAIFKSWFVDFDPVKAKIAAKQNYLKQYTHADNKADSPTTTSHAHSNNEELQHIMERAAMCAISGKTEAQLAALDKETLAQLKETAGLFPDALVESELGEIPEGWGVQRIDEIIELAYGKALKKGDRTAGDFPVYGSGGVTGTHEHALVNGPGVIVGRKGTVGALYWEKNSFFPIDTVFYVVCKDSISLNFAFLLLQTLGLQHMNTDAAVPGLNRNNVYRIEIPKYPQELIKAFTGAVAANRKKIDVNILESKILIQLRDTLLPKLLSGDIDLTQRQSDVA